MNELHNGQAANYTIAEEKGVGDRPGTLVAPPGSPPPVIVAYQYDADHFEEAALADIRDLEALRQPGRNLWLDVNGLGEPEVIAAIGEAFGQRREVGVDRERSAGRRRATRDGVAVRLLAAACHQLRVSFRYLMRLGTSAASPRRFRRSAS